MIPVVAPSAPIRGTYEPPTSIADVTRQLMYRADSDWNTRLDKTDVARDGKLAKALMSLAGNGTVATHKQVTRFVASFAGSDKVVSDADYLRMSSAIGRITSRLPSKTTYPKHQLPDLATAVRGMLSVADANYDGVVDRKDIAAQSDMARAVMEVSGRSKLDAKTMALAIKARGEKDLPAKIKAFIFESYGKLHEYGQNDLSMGDLGRAAIIAFDSNQDMRLTSSDGSIARNLLRAAEKSSLREHEVAVLYERYDVRKTNGESGADGRIDGQELPTLPMT
jgi:hypothetical protein